MTRDSRAAGGGTLFTEPILVVNQQARLIEAAREFGVFDQYGQPLGSVVEVGQTRLRKIIQVLTKYDKCTTHTFEVRDMGGSVVLKVAIPAKTLESRFLVTRADETPIGEIVPGNSPDDTRFLFVSNDKILGGIVAENWPGWDFSITDHTGAQIARVTKTFDESVKESFTAADNYAVEVYRHVTGPLASMVVASALIIGTALRQGERDT